VGGSRAGRSRSRAGERRSARLREGVPRPGTTLARCAWAAGRKQAGYRRLAGGTGSSRGGLAAGRART